MCTTVLLWYCDRVKYGHHFYIDSRVRVNRVRLQNNISMSPFAPGNLVLRDGFGRSVPRQPVTGFLPISAAAFIYLYRHTLSGQSRIYRVTQCVQMAFAAESPPAQGH